MQRFISSVERSILSSSFEPCLILPVLEHVISLCWVDVMNFSAAIKFTVAFKLKNVKVRHTMTQIKAFG